MQIQHMQMRMKLPLNHGTRYAQHFAKLYSEPCQASEMELFAKAVNALKPLKTVDWAFDRVLSTPLVSLSYTYGKGEGSRSISVA